MVTLICTTIYEIIEEMNHATETEEQNIISKYKQMPEEKRKVILKLLELVVITGKLDGAGDMDKRTKWFNLLKDVNNA